MKEPAASLSIRPDHLQIVRDILRTHIPDRTVWAFGSRVTGRAKAFSDLDLAILGDAPMSLSLHATLAEAFSESDLPWKVDLVDWATTSPSFRSIIEREKIVVQEAGTRRGLR